MAKGGSTSPKTMGQQSPKAQISGGIAAMPFGNALRTTRSTLVKPIPTTTDHSSQITDHYLLTTELDVDAVWGEASVSENPGALELKMV